MPQIILCLGKETSMVHDLRRLRRPSLPWCLDLCTEDWTAELVVLGLLTNLAGSALLDPHGWVQWK